MEGSEAIFSHFDPKLDVPLEQFMTKVVCWESNITEYQRESSEKISDQIMIAIVMKETGIG